MIGSAIVLRAPGIGLVLAALAVLARSPDPAHAGPYTLVPSAADPGDPIDVHLTLDYEFQLERSAITRERVGLTGDPDDPIPVSKDLVYRASRHLLTPTLEIGVFHDVWLAVRMPIVIRDSREILFDQRETPCSFTEPGATCINATNSSTILDGILPVSGFDAGDPAGFPAGDDSIFKGPVRHGLDRIYLGAGVAPMNQTRDDTKPTWKIGAELGLPVGKAARLDRDDPGSEAGVGTGVTTVKLSTSVAKRIGWAEPFFALWWEAPISAADDSPFADPGFGARNTLPQQQAGTHFGFEAIIVDRPLDSTRVGIELSSAVKAMFEGRNYTPMWEVFAYAGDTRHDGPLVLDADPTESGLQALDHPGITNVENYLELGARAAIRADIGKTVHLAGVVAVSTATQHTISFDDAGFDRPTCADGQTSNCETDNNIVIDSETEEVNPMHVPLVDLVGHRYILDDIFAVSFGVEAYITF